MGILNTSTTAVFVYHFEGFLKRNYKPQHGESPIAPATVIYMYDFQRKCVMHYSVMSCIIQ